MRDYLKEKRKSKGLTQQNVADELNISVQYYNLIENGERKKELTVTLIKKLAELFDVSFIDLADQEQKWSQSSYTTG